MGVSCRAGEEPDNYQATLQTRVPGLASSQTPSCSSEMRAAEEDASVVQLMSEMLTAVELRSRHPDGLLPVGVTTYNELFHQEELQAIEQSADEVHEKAWDGLLPPSCYHRSFSKGGVLKRTKLFFGVRCDCL